MADVRRSEHDLGQHPGERARFDRDGATLPIDSGTGHPAATGGQVGDDVTRARVRIDARREEAAGGAGARRSNTAIAAHVGA